MTLTSLPILLFFGVAVTLYFTVFRRCQWVWLLVISYVFYLLTGTTNLLFILLTTVTTYLTAVIMEKIDEKQKNYIENQIEPLKKAQKKQLKAETQKKKRIFLLGMVVFNLGILIVLKYCDFFLQNLNYILGDFAFPSFDTFGFVAPLGISYYTLQSIGYIVDVYKGKCTAEKNIFKIALFVSFFPQITQGPIGRFKDLANQLYETHKFSYKKLSFGCQRVLWGLFKKLVIADRLKPVVDTLYGSYQEYSGVSIFCAGVLLSIQIYADFSGYMDIVAGISQMFGIEIAENFKRPFFSKSLAEYWRRWHITLSQWFRDYVFYPLSLSSRAVRIGKFGRKYFSPRIAKLFPSVYALFIVWFCTGFWHDASWRYIFWGVANGIVIISSMCLEPFFNKVKNKLSIENSSIGWQLFSMIRTFLLVSVLKVFPGAGSTAESLDMVKRMVTDIRPITNWEQILPGFSNDDYIFLFIGLIIFFIVSIIQTKGKVREFLGNRTVVLRWGLYLVLLCFLLSMGVFGTDMVGGFAYAQY